MRRFLLLLFAIVAAAGPAAALGQAGQAERPVRLAVARLTHGHVAWLLDRDSKKDVEVVAIYEPDEAVARSHVDRYKIDRRIIYSDLGRMLDAAGAEAVVAFGSVAEHKAVVAAAAPRGIHVMVEKPLSFDAKEAAEIAALARRHKIHVLTNYETSWYPSRHALQSSLEAGEIGPIRKAVFRHGHWGPKEIGVAPEFLSWLTDPDRNGGGAIVDFGCYGANLMTWLMKGAAPSSVTAVTQRLKSDPSYARVDDEATLILTYPGAQAVVQASWNWPDHRKDIQLFGERGLLFAPNGGTLLHRRRGSETDASVAVPTLPATLADPFAYLAAVVRNRVQVSQTDPSSLENAVIVARILDAARRSARTGKTIRLDARRQSGKF